MQRITIILIILFFGFGGMAQNSCDDPLFIDNPQNVELSFTFDEINFQSFNTSCPPVSDSINYWAHFISDGPFISINIENDENLPVSISLIEFTTSDCDPIKFTLIDCAINELNSSLLVEGAEYFVIVNVPQAQDPSLEFTIALNNPHATPPPVNDEACGAISLPTDSICLVYSTIYAESLDSIPCETDITNDVWFSFELDDPLAFGIDVYIDSNDFQEDIFVEIGQFSFDSCAFNFISRQQYCGPANGLVMSLIDMDQNERYFLRIATTAEDEGFFDICLMEQLAAVNADPCAAQEITPNAACISFDTYFSLFDLDLPDCNFSNQILWYEFDTKDDLTGVRLALEMLGNQENVFLGLGYRMGNFCQNDLIWVDTYCGNVQGATINADDLKPFTLYQIAVGTNFGFTGEFNLCINGTYNSPFTNDNPCSAYELNDCVAGSSQYGRPNLNDTLCLDQGGFTIAPSSTLWYKILNSDSPIEIAYNAIDSIPIIHLQLGYFPNGCLDDFIVVNEICGMNENIELMGMVPDSIEYAFLRMVNQWDEVYNFQICLSDAEEPCGTNEFCENAEDLGIISSDSTTCYSLCNEGMTWNDTGLDYLDDYPTAWYTFTTAEDVQRYKLDIRNASYPFQHIALFRSVQGCADSLIQADYFQLSNSSTFYIQVEPSQKYYIALSTMNETGSQLELCFEEFNTDGCNISDRLEVVNTSMNSPLQGPYMPGEEISFCYTMERWEQLDCSWFQGVVPQFGTTWDTLSFDDNGQPKNFTVSVSQNTNVIWSWWEGITSSLMNDELSYDYNQGNPILCYPGFEQCSGTALQIGDTLPAGWFAHNVQLGDSPLVSAGDGNDCSSNSFQWTFCFDLIVGQPTNNNDLSVKIFTFADGEIGPNNWESDACQNDAPILRNFEMVCMSVPDTIVIDTITCSGNVLEVNLDQSMTHFFDAIHNPLVAGLESGSANEWLIELQQAQDTIVHVNYNFSSYNQSGCQAYEGSLSVGLYPALNIPRPMSYTVCQDDSVRMDEILDLKDFIIGDFHVNWHSDLLVDDPMAYWNGDDDETIPYEVINVASCTFQDTVEIQVEDILLYDPIPIFIVCRGDSMNMEEAVNLNELVEDEFTVDWEYGALADIPQADTSFEISTNIPFVLSGETGCLYFDTLAINVPHVNINVLGKREYCSTDTVSLSAGYIYNAPHERYWILPSGDTINGAGLARKASDFLIGENALKFDLFTEEGCPFFLNDTIRVYEFPELNIELDSFNNGICPGDSLLLKASVFPSDTAILWSTPFGETQEKEFYIQDIGLYTVEAGYESSTVSCRNSDSIYLEIYPEVITSFEYDEIVCIGDSTTIESNVPSYKFVWNTGSFASEVTVPPGDYSVTVSNDFDCQDIFAFTVEERLLPSPSFTYDSIICEGDMVFIVGSSPNNYDYLWDDGTMEAQKLSSGGYHTVTVTDDISCIDSFEFIIDQRSFPEIDLDYTLLLDTLYLMAQGTDSTSCSWLLNDEFIPASEDMILILPEGDYALSLSCENGPCVSMEMDSFTVILSAQNDIDLAKWNVFPNPSNGEFILESADDIYIYSVEIVDVQGKIWARREVHQSWNRMKFSEPLARGLYFIKILTKQGVITRVIVIE